LASREARSMAAQASLSRLLTAAERRVLAEELAGSSDICETIR